MFEFTVTNNNILFILSLAISIAQVPGMHKPKKSVQRYFR